MIGARQFIQQLAHVRRDRQLRAAFRAVFLDDDGNVTTNARMVLGYLRTVCGADVSSLVYDKVSGGIDPLATAAAEGRREVWLRTFYFFLNLDERELVEIDRNFSQQMKDLVERQEIYRE